jgi:hypothetical protein
MAFGYIQGIAYLILGFLGVLTLLPPVGKLSLCVLLPVSVADKVN